MDSREDWCRRLWITAAYSFLAGYADIVSYEKFRAFPTMMTGNVIFLGDSIINRGFSGTLENGCWFYAAILLTCFFSAAATRLLQRLYSFSSRCISLSVFAFCMVFSMRDYHAQGKEARSCVLYLTIVFGVQNTMLAKGPLGKIPGILMTSNLVNAGDIFAEFLAEGAVGMPIEHRRQGLTILANMSFVALGAACGALMWNFVTKRIYLITFPIACMLGFLLCFTDAFLNGEVCSRRGDTEPRNVQYESAAMDSEMEDGASLLELSRHA